MAPEVAGSIPVSHPGGLRIGDCGLRIGLALSVNPQSDIHNLKLVYVRSPITPSPRCHRRLQIAHTTAQEGHMGRAVARSLRSLRSLLGTLVLLLASHRDGGAQSAARLDRIIQSHVDSKQFMGSVLVAQDGKVLLDKGYGSANLEWDIPDSPQTKFRLGSLTKQFTAAAATSWRRSAGNATRTSCERTCSLRSE